MTWYDAYYWFLVSVVAWVMCGGLNLVTMNAYHIEFSRFTKHELQREHYLHAVLMGPLFTARMLYWLAFIQCNVRCLRSFWRR